MDQNDDIDRILSDLLAGDGIDKEDRKKLEKEAEISTSIRKLKSFIEELSGHSETLKGRTGKQLLYTRIRHSIHVRRRTRILFRSTAVAASILLLVGIWQYRPTDKTIPATPDTEKITAGYAQAELILPQGKVIRLSSKDSCRTVLTEKGLTVTNEENALVYASGEPAEKSVYHTLHIPKGGEYVLQLSDHSEVYLNSGSEIRFPVSFNGATRDVYLNGEAYFQVAGNAGQPFVVHMGDIAVKVLGTSFNVKAYSDEGTVTTTLEEGKVSMTAGTQEVVLTPGRQALYSKVSKKIQTRTVDTELHTSWRKGYYLFRGETLENILEILSRWYDTEVFYTDETVKHLQFGGRLKRYEHISYLLEQFESVNNISFEIKGKTIIVHSRQ